MIAREFVTAGHAVFTVANPTGQHFTYRVTTSDDPSRPAWFVGVLTGPSNETDYSYHGLFDPATGAVRTTAKSKVSADALSAKVLRWALDVVYGRRSLPAGYAIEHSGSCGRCGRTLTEPESLESGIGPTCRQRMDVAA